MRKIDSRIKRAAEGLMGNESLLEMVEGGAARELLGWGLELTKFIVQGTKHLGDEEAEAVLGPRLAALRLLLRTVGNWAAGKYADPSARAPLRDQLLELIAQIRGGHSGPTAEQLDRALQQAESGAQDAGKRIAALRSILESSLQGAPHVDS